MTRTLVRWGLTLSDRVKSAGRDRGAGFVEYAGLLLLIALMVAAVVGLNLHVRVANAVSSAVGDILQGN
ncbi:hypothetical protein [Streptomyces otsuchiensis]|uniref:hypothetical protein n=1 Tax=Streptomyces otsuchiensis TaxID=2681388 RepID=UPI00102FF72D|nr:hypothetical protein [Streptomyces otsuchiensis]